MKFRLTTTILCAMASLLFGFDCWAGPRGRYKVAVDPGSRYHFKYVQDKRPGSG